MNAVLRGDVHEIRIGANTNIQDNSVLHGMKQQWGVYLGDYVTVGHSVTLHGCAIEDRCLIGMGSIILNGAKIGAGSIIAAGTLIPEKTVVEPGSLWMGSPGKFRRKLETADEESIMRYANNYLGYKEEYLRERQHPGHRTRSDECASEGRPNSPAFQRRVSATRRNRPVGTADQGDKDFSLASGTDSNSSPPRR